MDENISNEQLKAQCEEYLEGWKRAQADYANLKRETEKERIEISKFANERLLSSILPAIDKYELALSHEPDLKEIADEHAARIKTWITGLKAVRALLETAFRSIGLEQVKTEGMFDPSIHEAVGEEPSEEVTEGNIIRVNQSGWSLNGKLLRPAKVIIAKSPSPET
jgi:molecular chaperone GrpE